MPWNMESTGTHPCFESLWETVDFYADRLQVPRSDDRGIMEEELQSQLEVLRGSGTHCRWGHLALGYMPTGSIIPQWLDSYMRIVDTTARMLHLVDGRGIPQRDLQEARTAIDFARGYYFAVRRENVMAQSYLEQAKAESTLHPPSVLAGRSASPPRQHIKYFLNRVTERAGVQPGSLDPHFIGTPGSYAQRMAMALFHEDYESAAVIRDEIEAGIKQPLREIAASPRDYTAARLIATHFGSEEPSIGENDGISMEFGRAVAHVSIHRDILEVNTNLRRGLIETLLHRDRYSLVYPRGAWDVYDI